MFQLQEDLRRRDIDINRLKAENEELARTLKREVEELESVKLRLPGKLKIAEDDLNDTKLKLATIEKKYAAIEARTKEVEEQGRRSKTAQAE